MFSPVATRDLKVWQNDWEEALHTVPYVHITKIRCDGPMHTMIGITCVMNVVGMNMRAVKDDFERVWAIEVAQDLRASHTIKETEKGFELSFLALDDKNSYVTGMVSIVRKDAT